MWVINRESYKKFLEKDLPGILVDPSFKKFCKEFRRTGYSIKNKALLYSQNKFIKNTYWYQQWQEKGRQVKSGEKGYIIIGWWPIKKKNKDTWEEEIVGTWYRKRTVFDISQTKPLVAKNKNAK